MKRCLFGGSFDPVHMGHLAIAGKAFDVCGLDQVIFLPCAQSPLKSARPIAGDQQRLDMLELALKGIDWAKIDKTDLELPPPSWSWRIAEHFTQQYPDGQLYWLMGADQWNDLEQWGRWDYLAGMVTFIVHHRQEELTPREGVDVVFIEGEYPASSSVLRKMFAAGEEIPSGWLNHDVLQYIENQRIYHY